MDPVLVFINKDLLEHSHAHSCIVCGCFHATMAGLSSGNNLCGPQSLIYLPSGPLRKILLTLVRSLNSFAFLIPSSLAFAGKFCLSGGLSILQHTDTLGNRRPQGVKCGQESVLEAIRSEFGQLNSLKSRG